VVSITRYIKYASIMEGRTSPHELRLALKKRLKIFT